MEFRASETEGVRGAGETTLLVGGMGAVPKKLTHESVIHLELKQGQTWKAEQ